MKTEKILTTFSYGLCVVSLENLQEFLREEKERSKKLLSFFQKKEKKYLLSQERGIWMPIPQINAGKYIIRVKGIDMSFDDEFEDIYIELPLTIEQFVKQALENEDDYPYDGFSADKYMDNL